MKLCLAKINILNTPCLIDVLQQINWTRRNEEKLLWSFNITQLNHAINIPPVFNISLKFTEHESPVECGIKSKYDRIPNYNETLVATNSRLLLE